MVFELSRRADDAIRSLTLDMRQVFAQWDIDTAAGEHRRRMLSIALAKQLSQQPNHRRLSWREPFQPNGRAQR